MPQTLVRIKKFHAAPPKVTWWRSMLGKSMIRPGIHIPSLSIEPGKCYAVIGKSGAGKSVLNSLLMGYPAFACGFRIAMGANRCRVSLGEMSWWNSIKLSKRNFASRFALASAMRNVRRHGAVLYLPQDLPTGPEHELPARKYMMQVMGALFRECHLPLEHEVSFENLPPDLKEKLSVNVNRLSGGERRRFELWARLNALGEMAGVGKVYALLVLDEPTTGLDVPSERQYLGELRKHLKRLPNASVVITTHALHLLNGCEFFDSAIVVHNDSYAEGDSADKRVNEILGREICCVAEACCIKDLLDRIDRCRASMNVASGLSNWEWFLEWQSRMSFADVEETFFGRKGSEGE